MFHFRDSWLTLVLLVLVLGLNATAQTDQLLPEINVYYKLNSDLSLEFGSRPKEPEKAATL